MNRKGQELGRVTEQRSCGQRGGVEARAKLLFFWMRTTAVAGWPEVCVWGGSGVVGGLTVSRRGEGGSFRGCLKRACLRSDPGERTRYQH